MDELKGSWIQKDMFLLDWNEWLIIEGSWAIRKTREDDKLSIGKRQKALEVMAKNIRLIACPPNDRNSYDVVFDNGKPELKTRKVVDQN